MMRKILISDSRQEKFDGKKEFSLTMQTKLKLVEIGEKEGRLQNWNKRAYYATTMEVFEIDWHLEEE